MDTRPRSKAKLIDTEEDTDIELEKQEYATHHDDLDDSADTEDDDALEDSDTDGGEVEPSVRPRRPLTTTDYSSLRSLPTSELSPPPPSLLPITDTYPVRRPSIPSTTDGTSTRTSLPPFPPSKVAKERKSYNIIRLHDNIMQDVTLGVFIAYRAYLYRQTGAKERNADTTL